MAEYDTENIFAKILSKELPCHNVFENETTIAFMDIMPRADGHVLVLPKTPSRNLLDIEQSDLNEVLATVKRIAAAQKKAFGADGITLQQFSEPAGGQVVFHTHFHVIPRFDGLPLKPHTGDIADDNLLASQAEKLKAALI